MEHEHQRSPPAAVHVLQEHRLAGSALLPQRSDHAVAAVEDPEPEAAAAAAAAVVRANRGGGQLS
jgi:hypothetical protein